MTRARRTLARFAASTVAFTVVFAGAFVSVCGLDHLFDASHFKNNMTVDLVYGFSMGAVALVASLLEDRARAGGSLALSVLVAALAAWLGGLAFIAEVRYSTAMVATGSPAAALRELRSFVGDDLVLRWPYIHALDWVGVFPALVFVRARALRLRSQVPVVVAVALIVAARSIALSRAAGLSAAGVPEEAFVAVGSGCALPIIFHFLGPDRAELDAEAERRAESR